MEWKGRVEDLRRKEKFERKTDKGEVEMTGERRRWGGKVER